MTKNNKGFVEYFEGGDYYNQYILLDMYEDTSCDETPYLEEIMDLMIWYRVFDIEVRLITRNSADRKDDYFSYNASEVFISNGVYDVFIKKLNDHLESLRY